MLYILHLLMDPARGAYNVDIAWLYFPQFILASVSFAFLVDPARSALLLLHISAFPSIFYGLRPLWH